MPRPTVSKGGPVTPEERAEIIRLHGENKGRNEIARLTRRSLRTVSLICEDEGLTFDRSATAAATEAKMQDAKARRAAIIEGLYDVAEDELAYLKQGEGYRLVEVSLGKPVKYTVDRLPAQDRKALVSSVSTATTAAARLEALDTNNGVDEGISMLGKLASGLSAAYSAMTEEGDSEGAGDAP
ncbi:MULTISPECIES: helix-turn-helix domain-containing protein [Streptomyces]|uniref:helix-turn-helix domain-containing protein n=1 Tax=Streptomyces TaxID=1883 RepID=UPI001D0B0195|nr:helix-turn-helix domain-containing protein [Streptomyces longhuiensis]UDM00069.1 helix-turn-helix domain-containing protein [Streptomyces longhuiensis]